MTEWTVAVSPVELVWARFDMIEAHKDRLARKGFALTAVEWKRNDDRAPVFLRFQRP